MIVHPEPGWRHLGTTSNADVFEIAADVVAVVPHPDCTDDEGSARESLLFQEAHWRKLGRRGAAVVFMDPVLAQDSGARAVYANESRRALSVCFALVGETFFGHAVSAVFTGLAKPAVPTQVFRSLAEARPWMAEMIAAHGGPV